MIRPSLLARQQADRAIAALPLPYLGAVRPVAAPPLSPAWRPILRDHAGRVISYRARARRPWWAPWRSRWCYIDWLAGDLWAAVRPSGHTTYHEPRDSAAASLAGWLS